MKYDWITNRKSQFIHDVAIYDHLLVSKFYLKSANIYTNQHDKHELWGALWPTDILKQNSKGITKQTHTDSDWYRHGKTHTCLRRI